MKENDFLICSSYYYVGFLPDFCNFPALFSVVLYQTGREI